MLLYLRLAWRNIWRHKRRTLIIVLSIAFTLALMMFYDGLIAGFQQAIYGNAIRVLGGNIQIHAVGFSSELGQNPLLPLSDDQAAVRAARANPLVAAASRRIVTGGLIANHKGALGVSVVGIEPELEQPVSLVAENVKQGRYLTAEDGDVMLIGKGMADALELQVGDRVSVAARGVHAQTLRRTLSVAGIYDLGMADLEKRSVYVSLSEAQSFLGMEGQSTEVMVTLQKIGQEAQVLPALRSTIAGAEITSWQTNFPELESAITTKSGVMNIFGVIILVIAGIGILNQLLMAVYERTREIGVLGALGMKPGQISAIFLIEGLLIGLVGLAAGVALGLGINLAIGQVGLDYSQFTSLTSYMALIKERIYPSLGTEKLVQRGVTVVVVSLIAALLPAREAAQNEPAKSLHYV